MSDQTFVIVISIIARLAIVAIFSYVVFWLGFSGWWFLLCLLICDGLTEKQNQSHSSSNSST